MTAEASDEQHVPASELRDFLVSHSNGGRWGDADDIGTVNLITPEKARQAVRLIRRGRSFSLSRPLATKPGRGNPRPAVHFLRNNNAWLGHEGVGAAAEFLGIDYHGLQTTHIDALCHTWNEDGGWSGSTLCRTPVGTERRAAAFSRGATGSPRAAC
jgi:hypothetical protein